MDVRAVHHVVFTTVSACVRACVRACVPVMSWATCLRVSDIWYLTVKRNIVRAHQVKAIRVVRNLLLRLGLVFDRRVVFRRPAGSAVRFQSYNAVHVLRILCRRRRRMRRRPSIRVEQRTVLVLVSVLVRLDRV